MVSLTRSPAGSAGDGRPRRMRADELDQAAAALAKRLQGRRVRDAEEARGVERLAGRDGHTRLVEKRLREIGGRADPVDRQGIADVDEQVERACRLATADPRIGGQPAMQVVAPLAVL